MSFGLADNRFKKPSGLNYVFYGKTNDTRYGELARYGVMGSSAQDWHTIADGLERNEARALNDKLANEWEVRNLGFEGRKKARRF